jgi:adenylosuccinate lyase
MIKRYEDPRIKKTWSLEEKYKLWQDTELAVIMARENLRRIPFGTYEKISAALLARIDAKKIERLEKKLQHDLNAFLEERWGRLSDKLKSFFHQDMTSYDTEESAFIVCLQDSCKLVQEEMEKLMVNIRTQAIKFRFTPMNGRTHGQEAEIQSFGKRLLTWYCDLDAAIINLSRSMETLKYSKLSGAIGTNSGIDQELETEALRILGFKPYHGATQILPRILFSPIASALSDLVSQIEKIALDIRLGARSGRRQLWQEPFSKKQKGSSAMPHKKNTIACENITGMGRMARKLSDGLKENIVTWEERAIEQSSVERVFWPNLFHVTIRAITVLNRVITGMVVFPDNMIGEIVGSLGTYASNEAKEFLTKVGLQVGLNRAETYRIVQLACFNAFEPSQTRLQFRGELPQDYEQADEAMNLDLAEKDRSWIRDIILEGRLRVHPELDANQAQVAKWNAALQSLFRGADSQIIREWFVIFKPSHCMRGEAGLFQKVFGV